MDPAGSSRRLKLHDNYRGLCVMAHESHQRGRAVEGISDRDVILARLYCYAFRLHVIGAFHATRVALDEIDVKDAMSSLELQRARESLSDLTNCSMDPVPADERALISTFHRYSTLVARAVDALDAAGKSSHDSQIALIGSQFLEHMQAITGCNGIYLTTDTHAPGQGTFVVPNLGIVIVPLVYGDHHSWNLAWLAGERSDVPFHLHHAGVEIHLGYSPIHGYTVLGDCKAEVSEGYAMPIPPGHRHGYSNIGTQTHHVPFVFGSQLRGGWGVYLDVEPSPMPLEQLRTKSPTSRELNGTIFLEREIDAAAAKPHAVRYPIIPARLTDRDGVGGLELSVSRVTPRGLTMEMDRFCAVSVVRGKGTIRMGGEVREISQHDHFGIPAHVTAVVAALDNTPLVLLDAVLKPA